MLPRLRFHQARLQCIVFGPPYVEADGRALTPRGSSRGIRRVLGSVGLVWLALLTAEGGCRLALAGVTDRWQFQYRSRIKSASRFRGVREPPNRPNERLVGSAPDAWGDLARLLNVGLLTAPYLTREDRTPKGITTDADGFRRSGGPGPAPVVLTGDSFFNSDGIGDSLSVRLGLPVYNRAIGGKQTLSTARALEEFATLDRPRVVVWEIVERTLVPETFIQLAHHRAALRRDGWRDRWEASLLWPENLDRYLTSSSWVRHGARRLHAEANWRITGELPSGAIRGRTDLGHPPLLFAADDLGLRPERDSLGWVQPIADVVVGIDRELHRRGTTMVFTIATC